MNADLCGGRGQALDQVEDGLSQLALQLHLPAQQRQLVRQAERDFPPMPVTVICKSNTPVATHGRTTARLPVFEVVRYVHVSASFTIR